MKSLIRIDLSIFNSFHIRTLEKVALPRLRVIEAPSLEIESSLSVEQSLDDIDDRFDLSEFLMLGGTIGKLLHVAQNRKVNCILVISGSVSYSQASQSR